MEHHMQNEQTATISSSSSSNSNGGDKSSIVTALLQEREARLDRELEVIGKIRLAFASILHLVEAAREDLDTVNYQSIDDLTQSSRKYRQAICSERQRRQQKRHQQQQHEDSKGEMSNSNKSTRRERK
jgi:hypothetical protein